MSESKVFHQQHPLRATLNLLSELELADALGVEERTLQMWRQQQRGPDYVKLGKQVFYRCEDVRDWINTSVQVVRRP
jgi:predicted DNA-binding transcriptional regulator AlpA